MKQFIKMIEVIREKGIITGRGTYHPPDKFWNEIERCRQFVFVSDKIHLDPVLDEPLEIDAPFPIFSIENSYGDLGAIRFRTDFWPYCLMVVELTPKTRRVLALVDDKDKDWLVVLLSNQADAMIHRYICRMYTSQTGTEATRATIRIGTGKSKRTHRIRSVIYVSPKKEINNPTISGRKIDWTHRFEVRGHWRKIDAVGKDREGNYCVNGFTWVSNHTKGSDALPLVKKVRVVSSEVRK